MEQRTRQKHTRREDIASYVTKDGSTIRELFHPASHGNRNQSFAEATVLPGGKTYRHFHRMSEELYHVTVGVGVVTVGEEKVTVCPGDTVCIKPGEPHNVENTGTEELKFFCMSSPPYSHEDTVILEK